jgi:hypothetical protein
MLGSSWVAAQLAASPEGLNSKSEWVMLFVLSCNRHCSNSSSTGPVWLIDAVQIINEFYNINYIIGLNSTSEWVMLSLLSCNRHCSNSSSTGPVWQLDAVQIINEFYNINYIIWLLLEMSEGN